MGSLWVSPNDPPFLAFMPLCNHFPLILAVPVTHLQQMEYSKRMYIFYLWCHFQNLVTVERLCPLSAAYFLTLWLVLSDHQLSEGLQTSLEKSTWWGTGLPATMSMNLETNLLRAVKGHVRVWKQMTCHPSWVFRVDPIMALADTLAVTLFKILSQSNPV